MRVEQVGVEQGLWPVNIGEADRQWLCGEAQGVAGSAAQVRVGV